MLRINNKKKMIKDQKVIGHNTNNITIKIIHKY